MCEHTYLNPRVVVAVCAGAAGAAAVSILFKMVVAVVVVVVENIREQSPRKLSLSIIQLCCFSFSLINSTNKLFKQQVNLDR